MMNVELLPFLGWSALLNYLILMLWFAVYVLGEDWLYSLHSNWFSITREQFSVIHYSLMAMYKLGIFLFLLGPFAALLIMS